jgi:hypothetical protein
MNNLGPWLLPENHPYIYWGQRYRAVRTYVPNSCPAQNFVIRSWILKLFPRNDNHIETTCRAQHLGRYLEGQGHSMTLQQNRVQPITLLFEVGFYNYFTEIISILRKCSQHLGCFYTLNFVCDITLTLQEVYLPVSKTY